VYRPDPGELLASHRERLRDDGLAVARAGRLGLRRA
jgi:hypothetical protein